MPLANLTEMAAVAGNSTFVTTVEDKLQQLAGDPLAILSDPLGALRSIDAHTVALAGVGVLFAVFAIDLIAYLIARYQGGLADFTPMSRSLADMASDLWESRPGTGPAAPYYDPYEQTRNVERMSPVLDRMAKAQQKWQYQEYNKSS